MRCEGLQAALATDANRFTRCHVWGGPVKPPRLGELPEMLKNSVCFKSNGTSTIFRDCWVNADVRDGELTIRIVGQNGKNFGERKLSGMNATQIEVGAAEANNPFSLVFISTGGARLYSFWMGGAAKAAGQMDKED